jgi:hypothetical protein
LRSRGPFEKFVGQPVHYGSANGYHGLLSNGFLRVPPRIGYHNATMKSDLSALVVDPVSKPFRDGAVKEFR